jgi:hypothetical protein
VSLPVGAADTNRVDVFPTSTTPLYSYDAGYTSGETMEIGRGYWLKFPADDVVFLGADSVSEATATVAEGWNMVGSISVPIPVSSIGSDPPGLVTGPFYGYGHGYQTSETLEPGKGYWVKVSGPGTLNLSASPASAGAKTIIITPDTESPPPPPGEVNALAGGGLPGEFAIRQNYPNPFNPVTRIEYNLPVKSVVSLSIYNTLGQQVAMLVNGEREAGVNTIDFDASSLPTGVYVCRISAGTHVLTTRMMLLR